MSNVLKMVEKLQIHTSIHITRRKQMNIVTNADGESLWTGASIFEACRWCIDNERYSVTMWKDGEHIRLILGEPTD